MRGGGYDDIKSKEECKEIFDKLDFLNLHNFLSKETNFFNEDLLDNVKYENYIEILNNISYALNNNNTIKKLYINFKKQFVYDNKFIRLKTEAENNLAEALKTMTALSELYIYDTRYELIIQISEVLPHRKNLRTLKIKYNNIDEKIIINLSKTLSNNKNLIIFDFINNTIININANRNANINANIDINVYDILRILISAIHNNNTIQSLNINDQNWESNHDMSQDSTYLLDTIYDKKSLKYLNLSNNTFDDEQIILLDINLTSVLKNLSVLTTFIISDCSITINIAKSLVNALKNNNTIITFDISNIKLNIVEKKKKSVVKELIKVIPSMKQLKLLDISNNKIGQYEDVNLFLPIIKMKNLTYLDISKNNLAYAGGIQSELQNMTELTYLDISDNNLSNSELSDNVRKYLPSVLMKMTKLEDLNISHNFFIEEYFVISLVGVLDKMPNLKIFDISYNKIDNLAAKALAQKLLNMKNLTTLKISETNIGNEELNILLETFKKMTHLTTLDISKNKIDDIGVKTIANELPNMKNLTTLKIGNKKITKAGSDALFEAVKDNNKLSIDISNSI